MMTTFHYFYSTSFRTSRRYFPFHLFILFNSSMLVWFSRWADYAALLFTYMKSISVGPIPIAVGLLCIHTLVVNFLFGHPTYWRKGIPRKNVSSDKLPAYCAGRKMDLERIHPDLIIHILGYLDPKELTVIAQVSCKYRTLSESCIIWNNLAERLPARWREQYAREVSADSSILRYFQLVHIIAERILADKEKLIIRVHGDLFDLSHFAAEHPGGMAILEEYKGGDGTRIFDLAKHSEYARELSENLIIFSPTEYKGAEGIPNFARPFCICS